MDLVPEVVLVPSKLRDSGVVLAGVVSFLDVPHAVLLLTVLSSRKDAEEGMVEKHVIPFSRALVDQVTARAWSTRKGQYAAAIPTSRLEWLHFGGIERRVTASLLGDMHHLVSTLPLVFGWSKGGKGNERVVYKKTSTERYSSATQNPAGSLRFTISDAVDGMAIFEMKTGSCTLRVPAQDCASGSSLLCCSNCHGGLGTDFNCRMCPSKSCPCTCVCSECFQAEDGVSMGHSVYWRRGAQGCAGCAFMCVECGDRKPLGLKAGCASRYCQNEFPAENTCMDCLHTALPDIAQGGQCFECRQVFCGGCLDACEHPGCGNKFCRGGSGGDLCQDQLFQCGLCNTRRCNHARTGFHMEMLDCSHCGEMRCYTCDMEYCMCHAYQYCGECARDGGKMVGGRCSNCRENGYYHDDF